MQNPQTSPPITNASLTVPWDNPVDADYRHASPEAYEAFQDWKFGLRIHAYVSSQIGARLGSWLLYERELTFHAEYHALYKTYNPSLFDADRWTRMIADAGMKYFTFVTKHHDGYCPWPTKTRVKKRFIYTGPRAGTIEDCDFAYSTMDTPFKRDQVGELVAAGRNRGLGIGLYFSHWDWFDADFRWSGIGHVPYEANFSRETHPDAYARFLKRYEDQIVELLTWYGKIDLFEFDCEPRGTYEAFRQRQIDDWSRMWPDIKRIIKHARKLQPDVLFRERGIGAYGDFHTPEWTIPDDLNAGAEHSPHVKVSQVIYPCFEETREWILEKLIDVVSKGGNLQIGYLPLCSGAFTVDMEDRLHYVGRWLRVNGEAIYATRARSRRRETDGPNVRLTRSKDGRYVYAICLSWPGRELRLNTVSGAHDDIRLLGVDLSLPWRQEESELIIELPEGLQEPSHRPCEQAWAFKIPVDPATEDVTC